jgi:hypothetical protein
MKRNISTAQSGYALILMVLALMGVGGVVLAGFTQGVKVQSEHERYLHNQRVLREAKQALLQYAYNYPVTAGNGPGRLPCPDTDSDGIPNATAFCGGANGIVGRFPWAEDEMNFYEARDASGETLWYAVSNQFANSGSLTINSATLGTINIEDRSGAPIHDATTGGGVAAVIIAPGSAIDRNGVIQDRAADPEDPENYLDLFGAVDNADFVNLTANGFVTGPIEDVVGGDILVNDQMIVITAAEVIAMAEQATLQAYRAAILDYLSPDKANGVYPWLYNYDEVTNPAELKDYYPANASFATELLNNLNPGNYGRIPSIFAEYFERVDSQPFESDIKAAITIDYESITPVPSTISHGSLPLQGDGINPAVHVLEFTIPASELTDLRFVDDAPGSNRRLIATLAAPKTYNQPLYFWDEAEGPRTGVWSLCPNGGDELEDCHRDSSQNPNPGGANESKEEILILDLEVSLAAGTMTIDVRGPPATAITAADSDSHAAITGTFRGLDFDISASTAADVTVSWEYDAHYHDGEAFEIQESGDLSLADLVTSMTVAVELRYFPELPAWAYDNDWHDSIRMAYADDYLPDTLGACNVTPDDNCLKTTDLSDIERRNKISLLVIAGEHDWVDDNDPGLQDDLADVFDAGNAGNDDQFLVHEGNDKILVIEEL